MDPLLFFFNDQPVYAKEKRTSGYVILDNISTLVILNKLHVRTTPNLTLMHTAPISLIPPRFTVTLTRPIKSSKAMSNIVPLKCRHLLPLLKKLLFVAIVFVDHLHIFLVMIAVIFIHVISFYLGKYISLNFTLLS